jgi:hypothetical protein
VNATRLLLTLAPAKEVDCILLSLCAGASMQRAEQPAETFYGIFGFECSGLCELGTCQFEQKDLEIFWNNPVACCNR